MGRKLSEWFSDFEDLKCSFFSLRQKYHNKFGTICFLWTCTFFPYYLLKHFIYFLFLSDIPTIWFLWGGVGKEYLINIFFSCKVLINNFFFLQGLGQYFFFLTVPWSIFFFLPETQFVILSIVAHLSLHSYYILEYSDPQPECQIEL